MERNTVKKYYGKLPPHERQRMDELLLKMQRLNSEQLKKRVILKDEIVPLPESEYIELWGYLRHCCTLVASWPNKARAIRTIASYRGMDVDETRDEAIDSMTIHCYTYVWRHYDSKKASCAAETSCYKGDGLTEEELDCGYVLSTAKFGFQTWLAEQNRYNSGIKFEIEEAYLKEPHKGRKVNNVNIM